MSLKIGKINENEILNLRAQRDPKTERASERSRKAERDSEEDAKQPKYHSGFIYFRV